MGDRDPPVDDTHGKSTWEQVADTTAAAAAVVKDKLEHGSSGHDTPAGNVSLGSERSSYDQTTPGPRDEHLLSEDARDSWRNAQSHAKTAAEEAGHAVVQTARDTTAAGQQFAGKVQAEGSEKLRQGSEAVRQSYDSAAHSAQQTGDQLKASAQDTWDNLRKRSKELSEQGQEQLHGAQDSARDAWDTVQQKSQRLYDSGKENVNEAADKARDKSEDLRGRATEKADQLGDRAAFTAEQARRTAEDAKHKGQAWYSGAKQDAREHTDRAGDKLRELKEEGRQSFDEKADQGRHAAERLQHRGQELYQDAKHNAKEGAGQLAGFAEDTGEESKRQMERGRRYADDKAHQARQKAEDAQHKGEEWYKDAKHEAKEKTDHAAAGAREAGEEAKQRAKEVDQASKDVMRSFIEAMGSVPPFTWLERATRDQAASSPYGREHKQDTVESQASGLAHDASHAAHKLLHRAERGIAHSKDAVVDTAHHWSEVASGKNTSSNISSRDAAATPEGKDDMDRAVERTEAETKGMLHSVNRTLTAPWRAFDRFNHRNAERMRADSKHDDKLSTGRIPSNTAAEQGRDHK